ncbi:MAG: electron transfer flavoprotein subunit alpha/FixB family protein [Cyclobacteriaceae bacterium]|nr:electron transfer flavoprotein subunit alpha/FixB family protein [Cyclobacteriaceae bacterium]MCH8516473.1 electron transfer flavoprotein subunit alpha/FixB family protein [Cyclobacteriaceae bacterium]
MSVVVFIEHEEGKVKKSGLEAVSFAKGLSKGDVVAVAIGANVSSDELAAVGKAGASKVLHVNDEKLNKGVIQAYSHVLAEAIKSVGAKHIVLAKSSLGDPVAARLAVKLDAALIANVSEVPADENDVKTSIFTGKAFANTKVTKENKIFAIKKNAATVLEDGSEAAVEEFSTELSDDLFVGKITGEDKAKGEILLPEADLVVSGGRGLKGPENWNLIEDLARALNAATGCSKPVSDMDWRPHHEHVGQTGVKVAPTLYIAVGISGAIQHLAGVNSSKVIVVINQDEEAPFFKAADYGIVGDAFEILPKLTEAVKAQLN